MADWLGGAAPVMEAAGMADARLQHVRSRSYELACNWKVFSDNYLVRRRSLCNQVMHTQMHDIAFRLAGVPACWRQR